MRAISRETLLFVTCISAACSGHRVPHVAPDESRPHITWEIRSGGDLGDDRLVCGSSQPSLQCVLTASTADRPSLTAVHLYLHAARQQTSYLGVMQVPLMEGSARRADREVSATVPPGSQPVGHTVTGNVTSKAGDYTLSVSLDAIQPGMTMPQRIQERASVTVK